MITVRAALAVDLPAINEIIRNAYSIYLDRMPKPPAPMLSDYRPAVDEGRVDVLVCDDQIVGLVSLSPSSDTLLIENVAVEPRWQGRGLGRLLMEHAEHAARRAGIGELRLYTNAAMSENVAFYRQLGFDIVDQRTDDGYDRVFMRKHLTTEG